MGMANKTLKLSTCGVTHQEWSISLHAYSDLTNVSPVVFLHLLKECYVYVEALETISSRLQYSNWRVAQNSCSGGGGLNVTISLDGRIGSNVTCNCNSTVCHITHLEVEA